MLARIVSDLDAVPSAAPSREPLMAATLALTSSGNISPISDLDAVPSGGSLTGAADGRYPCADSWAGASPNAQPGSELKKEKPRTGPPKISSVWSGSGSRIQDAACMGDRVVGGLSVVLAYRFGRTTRDIPLAIPFSTFLPPPRGPAADLTLQIVARPRVRNLLAESPILDSAMVSSSW